MKKRRKVNYSQHNRQFKVKPREYRKIMDDIRKGVRKRNDFDIFKRNRSKPYGAKMLVGYGGEEFYTAYRSEILEYVVNKGRERRNNRIDINKAVRNEE